MVSFSFVVHKRNPIPSNSIWLHLQVDLSHLT